MAKVRNNIITQGLSGSLGDQIVFRNLKTGRTIVAVKPVFDQQSSATQLAHQEAFRQAIAYAKTAKTEAIYVSKAQGTALSPFNAAVADWFKKPEILEIDVNGWTGQIGQSIRVKAMDDTLVTKIHVTIVNDNNELREEGDAVQADGLWWVYTTKTIVQMDMNPVVTATAQDRPGNSAEMALQN